MLPHEAKELLELFCL